MIDKPLWAKFKVEGDNVVEIRPWVVPNRWSGSSYCVYGDYHLSVFMPRDEHGTLTPGWGMCITHVHTGRMAYSDQVYPTSDDAQLAALDAVQRCIERKWQ
jgi:hypothetical protein